MPFLSKQNSISQQKRHDLNFKNPLLILIELQAGDQVDSHIIFISTEEARPLLKASLSSRKTLLKGAVFIRAIRLRPGSPVSVILRCQCSTVFGESSARTRLPSWVWQARAPPACEQFYAEAISHRWELGLLCCH